MLRPTTKSQSDRDLIFAINTFTSPFSSSFSPFASYHVRPLVHFGAIYATACNLVGATSILLSWQTIIPSGCGKCILILFGAIGTPRQIVKLDSTIILLALLSSLLHCLHTSYKPFCCLIWHSLFTRWVSLSALRFFLFFSPHQLSDSLWWVPLAWSKGSPSPYHTLQSTPLRLQC